MTTRKQRLTVSNDAAFIDEPRWKLLFRVFHWAGDPCARSNCSPDVGCGYVCAALIEILRDWDLTDSTATTLRQLLETIRRLPSFNDVDNRSYWLLETDEDALQAPTLSRDALVSALRELQELRSQRPDPEWSYVYERALDDGAAFVAGWLKLLDAHEACSNVVEFRAYL